jgi:hypothetical protein
MESALPSADNVSRFFRPAFDTVLIAAEKQEDALSCVPVPGYSETNAATVRADANLKVAAALIRC